MIKNNLVDLISKSNSLELLRKINENISERKFHEFTHILYDLVSFINKNQINYLEIGSYIGSSSCLILNHPIKTNIYCIDPLNLDKNHFKGNFSQEETLKKNLLKNNVNNDFFKIYKKYSNDKNLLEEIKKLNFDIIFIDGCHKYKSVIDDFNNYKNLLNNNGFIIFDDYGDIESSPEVKKAVDFLFKNDYFKDFIIIGQLPNIKKANSKHFKKISNQFILYKN